MEPGAIPPVQGQHIGAFAANCHRGLRVLCGKALRIVPAIAIGLWLAMVPALTVAWGAGPVASSSGKIGEAGTGKGAGRTVRIVVLGDSLTAGYGVAQSAAFPVRLEAALRAKSLAVEVSNAGVSGDTTSGGLERIDWAVPDGTDMVIVELGANDVLRGLEPDAVRRNLEAIIVRLKTKGATVLLAGMRSLTNWGAEYAAKFEAIFPALAARHDVALYPFFLDGVAARAELNQDDGLHPNAKGVDEIVRRILPAVERVIATVKAARGG